MSSSRAHRSKNERPNSVRQAKPAAEMARDSGDFLVVGIGASAGGLDACRKLIDALPADSGMAFIIVQHLDPNHESMLVDLLGGHTAMPVRQATDGMPIERGHIYVIPPGSFLSAKSGTLHLTQPQARHGARLPFDFLLHSLAEAYGDRAACIILSGTGTDGTLGLKAVKEKGGLVIAQDPDEASYDGMPRSAIATKAVDLVLPVAKIPAALVNFVQHIVLVQAGDDVSAQEATPAWLPKIIALLREKTPHDFTLYKEGTLQRRIERRMALATIKAGDAERYIDLLQRDHGEVDRLAKDLLINVTAFFRDPQVFEYLAENFAAEVVRSHSAEQPIRIWVPGCSTGEEAYSLAILFLEAIAAAKRNIRLQVFASDIDPEAIATAREGFYPEAVEADVSPARLAQFFIKEDRQYRVHPDLRAVVVFTVQDVLADPPFSRLDMISCRNLMIYLRPEAQAKVTSIFHFALRDGGVLLLGNAETLSGVDGRFQLVAKSEKFYRHVGRSRPGELGFSLGAGDLLQARARPEAGQIPSRQSALAALCRRLTLEMFAPAAILVNRKLECLYSLGPAERYLRVAPGHPTHDLISMTPPGMRTKLRSAIQQATQVDKRVVVQGARLDRSADTPSFSIDVTPVKHEDEDLLLVCFIDEPKAPQAQKRGRGETQRELPRIAELEAELEATRAELHGAIRNLEVSTEEQKAINEEAMSVNEEFQSTNEELLTSKEELQSLNEELTVLNSQLQETLERQRTTANDLQNVLYSTDVATLFLDSKLNIRFFTPATKALFNVIPGDIGRPLADLSSLAVDGTLLVDAAEVLRSSAPMEREIETRNGTFYLRRILPYRADDSRIGGVVITFADISERKKSAESLLAAKRQAERANVTKSRFLAAASHDLRQPLQTLALVQGLLAKKVAGDAKVKLVKLLEQTLGAMTGMLNTLLDINQIDAGNVRPERVGFSVNDLLERLTTEFTYHAQVQGIEFRVVPCRTEVFSDPRLLEQMIRNLLSNALKYTKRGKVLLGCRHRANTLAIEVWDTGVGIPEGELKAIFDEYHQIDNAARERSRGLGLGLSIVQRLGDLLGHRVSVQSVPGKGSKFSIELVLPTSGAASTQQPDEHKPAGVPAAAGDLSATILVIEDDPEVCELLDMVLKDVGHRTEMVRDGAAALELVARGGVRPDVILADYNLPNGMNGLEVTAKLRDKLHRQTPVIILTGDISTDTLRDVARQKCLQLNKPVRLQELTEAIQRVLPPAQSTRHVRVTPTGEAKGASEKRVVYVVDDDALLCQALRAVLEADGRVVEDFGNCEDFLEAYRPGGDACLLIDAYLPGMNGLELLQRLAEDGCPLPSIMITGDSDVPMAVQAMKAGAADFIEKPVGAAELLASIDRAVEQAGDASKLSAWHASAATQLAGLTGRQRQIMDMVLAGHPNKNIAADLGISQRTVENHRALIMKKTGSKSLPALARLALAAASASPDAAVRRV